MLGLAGRRAGSWHAAKSTYPQPVKQTIRVRGRVEAVLDDTEPSTSRSGVLIGMVACAVSGGVMGFVAGILVGLLL